MPYKQIWVLNFEGVWPKADPFFWFERPEKNDFPLRVLTIRAAAYLGDVRGDFDVFPLKITFLRNRQEELTSLNPGSPVARELIRQLKTWAKNLVSEQKELKADIGEVRSLVDLASEFIDLLM